jgi:light-regulated signal transduction histidine kinase (bacteriophytochrome)
MQFNLQMDQSCRDRLDQCEREIQRFLDVLVHDLRATQRAISTSAELLAAESQTGPEAHQLVAMLKQGVSRMNAVLAGVSNFSLSVPSASYSFGPVPMEISLQLALSRLTGEIRDCSGTVTRGTLPQVRGNAERLTLVLQNLLENALRYRSDADLHVDIQAEKCPDHWKFSVHDNGIGIAQRYWDGLFVPFHRLHGPEIPGVGLGLATCKRIVEAHGGKIWLDSKAGEGSTFFFTLPLDSESD